MSILEEVATRIFIKHKQLIDDDDDDDDNNNYYYYNIVCLRNISINTLQKGDDDDDNNNNNNNCYCHLETNNDFLSKIWYCNTDSNTLPNIPIFGDIFCISS